MTKSTKEIIAVLNSISNVTTDDDQLYKLDNALKDIDTSDQPLLTIEPLLRIFERFPESDGFGGFGTILHKLEAMPGYEPFLIASVKRNPSEFSVRMINRIINAGQSEVEGVSLVPLLADIEANRTNSEEIRKTARRYLEYQQTKT